MGRKTIPEVRDGSWDPPRGPGRVRRTLGWSGTGREVFLKVWNGSRIPPGGPVLVGTLPEVRDGSGDHP